MARSSSRSDGGSAALSALDNLAISPHTRPSLLKACMVAKDENDFRRQARVLKTLANESRFQIVDRLSRGECSVGELTDLVGSDRSTVSKHLAGLRAHGIVNELRDGNVVYYSLLTPCVMNFFSCAPSIGSGPKTVRGVGALFLQLAGPSVRCRLHGQSDSMLETGPSAERDAQDHRPPVPAQGRQGDAQHLRRLPRPRRQQALGARGSRLGRPHPLRPAADRRCKIAPPAAENTRPTRRIDRPKLLDQRTDRPPTDPAPRSRRKLSSALSRYEADMRALDRLGRRGSENF